jgi:hypothetical protein
MEEEERGEIAHQDTALYPLVEGISFLVALPPIRLIHDPCNRICLEMALTRKGSPQDVLTTRYS